MLGNILLLALTLAAASSELVPFRQTLLQNGCPADFHVHHLLPHEVDCAKFYYCVFGEKVERECGAGTVFNYDIQVCDWPANVNCENKESTSESSEHSSSNEDSKHVIDSVESGVNESQDVSSEEEDTVIILENGCPADWRVDRLLPHESSCTDYYYCVHGELVQMTCPETTFFNAEMQVCDHPKNAECPFPKTEGDKENSSEESNESNSVDEQSSSVDSEETNSGNNDVVNSDESVGDGWLDNGCPADIHISYLLPHETYCNRFYYCNFGNLVERDCAEGTAFDANIQGCDWIQSVDCGGRTIYVEPEIEEADEESPPPAQGHHVEMLENGCPADSNIFYLLPDAVECNKFYFCNFGQLIQSSCGESLVFNAAEQVCDYPEYVDCENNHPPPLWIEAPEEEEVVEVTCPEDGQTHVLLAHPSSCSNFYSCVHGEKVEMSCVDGLHFDQDLQVCNWPQAVNCINNEKSEVVARESCDWPINELRGDATDCSTFYYCVHGQKHERQCRNGLFFNVKAQVCDWPRNVKCAAPPAHHNRVARSAEDYLPNGCPSDFTVSQLLPHETDCQKFYFCNFGSKVEATCGEDTVFNSENQACDWPENVVCPSVVDDTCDWPITELRRDENNCAVFHYCIEGIRHPQTCWEGSVFNQDLQVCDWPWNVDCGQSTYESSVNMDTLKMLYSRVQAPQENTCDWPITELRASDADCTKFYYCINGQKVERSCGELYFDETTQTCNWPNQVQCQAESNADSGENENVEDDSCPVNWNPIYLLPHLTYCERFYFCVDKRLVERSCPTGTYYNSLNQECDWPQNVNCVHDNPDHTRCQSCNTGPWAHATDCTKYWSCQEDKAVLSSCTDGLHYNSEKQTCDLQGNARCN